MIMIEETDNRVICQMGVERQTGADCQTGVENPSVRGLC